MKNLMIILIVVECSELLLDLVFYFQWIYRRMMKRKRPEKGKMKQAGSRNVTACILLKNIVEDMEEGSHSINSDDNECILERTTLHKENKAPAADDILEAPMDTENFCQEEKTFDHNLRNTEVTCATQYIPVEITNKKNTNHNVTPVFQVNRTGNSYFGIDDMNGIWIMKDRIADKLSYRSIQRLDIDKMYKLILLDGSKITANHDSFYSFEYIKEPCQTEERENGTYRLEKKGIAVFSKIIR